MSKIELNWSEFEIDGKSFKWGQTLDNVIQQFGRDNLHVGYNVQIIHKVASTGFLGLEGVSCEFFAPALDKPVTSISFELKPLKIGWFQKPYTPYVRHLEQRLGKPNGVLINPLPSGQKYDVGYSSSSVIYAPHWWFGDYRIGLSVYGGIRSEKLGATAAALYIGWYNSNEIAKPYIQAYYNKEAEIYKGLIPVSAFELNKEQYKNYVRHHEVPGMASADNDDDQRAAQLSVFYNNLYRTPPDLSNAMKKNQIVLLHSSQRQEYVLATKFDCTIVNLNAHIEFRSVLPAKGSGGTELKLGAITIYDTINSLPLTNLKNKLESLGFDVKSMEYYDC